MAGTALLRLRDTLRTVEDISEDEELDAQMRRPLPAEEPVTDVWDQLDVAFPPETFLLTSMRDGDSTVWVMLWKQDADAPADEWPIVSVSDAGDAQVVALDSEAWIEALVYTGGMLGGGTEEDLEAAREEASRAALTLAGQLEGELDLSGISLNDLESSWEEAQDDLADDWSDAAEGMD